MQCKKCGSRNKGYKLKDGSCIPQFSFRAVYETSEDDNISFIYDLYKENIIELEVDKEKFQLLIIIIHLKIQVIILYIYY